MGLTLSEVVAACITCGDEICLTAVSSLGLVDTLLSKAVFDIGVDMGGINTGPNTGDCGICPAAEDVTGELGVLGDRREAVVARMSAIPTLGGDARGSHTALLATARAVETDFWKWGSMIDLSESC